MSDYKNVLKKCADMGIDLWTENGKLKYKASTNTLSQDILRELKKYKEQIIEYLEKENQDLIIVHDDVKRYEAFPLTEVQSAYLLGREDYYDYGNTACHVYQEFVYERLDVAKVEMAWNKLIQKHDALRTVIYKAGYQKVLETTPYFEVHEYKNMEDGSKELERIRDDFGRKVFPLEKWPMFEIAVSQFEDKSRLHFSMDFLVADWASIWMLLEEFEDIYFHNIMESSTDITFRDYVLFEERKKQCQKYEEDRAFWQKKLPHFCLAPSLPNLNTRKSKTVEFERYSLRMGIEEWKKFKKNCASHNITPTAAVLTVYGTVLKKWSFNKEVCLNLTVLNRETSDKNINKVVGDFTKILLLEIRNLHDTFSDMAQDINATLFESLDHCGYSGVDVIRDISKTKGREYASMPYVFTSAIGLIKNSLQGKYEGIGISQTPQVFIDCQAMDGDFGLQINWDVRKGVFENQLIRDMFQIFEMILNQLAADQDMWENKLSIALPEAQRKQREQVNCKKDIFDDKLLYTDFLKIANIYPNYPAIYDDLGTITYGELLKLSASIAARLQEEGVKENDKVVVMIPKNRYQIGAVLAVLYLGGAYVPIDITSPVKRTENIISQCNSSVVLKVTEVEYDGLAKKINVNEIDYNKEKKVDIKTYDTKKPAYVIFTSGTTGVPKGVIVSHHAALNTICDINKTYGVTKTDCVLALSKLNFDLSVYDIFGMLSVGGSIVYVNDSNYMNPKYWHEKIVEHGVTIWNSVPALKQLYLAYLKEDDQTYKENIRLCLLSGDWIPLGMPEEIKKHNKYEKIICLGGATEAAIWSISHEYDGIKDGWKSIPYGKPLANQQLFVVDDNGEDCPVGCPGELYIAGEGLADGYLGDEELTEKKFFYSKVHHCRVYATGDLGRYMDTGEIEFLGRMDTQVKVRGYRIELGEIENALVMQPEISNAVVRINTEKKDLPIEAVVEIAKINSQEKDAILAQSRKLIKSLECVNVEFEQILDRTNYKYDFAKRDEIALISVLHGLIKVGCLYNGCTLEEIINSEKVAPKYRWLLSRWVKVLEEKGYILKTEDEKYSIVKCYSDEEYSYLMNDVFENWVEEYGDINLMSYIKDNAVQLQGILEGNIDPVGVLYPEGSTKYTEALYVTSSVAKIINNYYCHFILEYIKNNSDRKIRILEIGAGTAATAKPIIQALGDTDYEYYFTDITKYFFPAAKNFFKDNHRVVLRQFNVDEDYKKQGFQPNYFDIVIGAYVLENVKDIKKSINIIKELVAPQGYLLFSEPVRNEPWILASQALMMTEPEDDIRKDTFFIPPSGWIDVLDTCDITSSTNTFPEEESSLYNLGAVLFIKQFKTNTCLVNREKIKDNILRYIPEYMMPSSMIYLNDFPLSLNGKIDSKKLFTYVPEIVNDKIGISDKSGIQSELEKNIQEVWKEILEIDQLGAEDNFYDHGADSLIMAQAVTKIREKLRIEIPFESLLREMINTPTVHGCAEYISKHRVHNIKDKEEELPLFFVKEFNETSNVDRVRILVHGALGTVENYSDLGNALSKQNIGRVVAFGIADYTKYMQIDTKNLLSTLASQYVKYIYEKGWKNIQLIGYSFSGSIIIEMARMLMEQNVNVDNVVIIEGGSIPINIKSSIIIELLFLDSMGISETVLGISQVGILKAVFEAVKEQGLPSVDDNTLLSILQNDIDKEKMVELIKRGESERWEMYQKFSDSKNSLKALFGIYRKSFEALQTLPDIYFGDVTYCSVKEREGAYESFDEITIKWEDILLGNIKQEMINGNHYNCITEKNAEKVATLLMHELGVSQIEQVNDLVTDYKEEAITEKFLIENDLFIQFALYKRKESILYAMICFMKSKDIFADDNTEYTFDEMKEKLNIAPKNEKILLRWLRNLKAYGIIQATNNRYRLCLHITEEQFEETWSKMLALWNGKLCSELGNEYLLNNIKKLSELFSGHVNPTHLLFPEGKFDYANALYKETFVFKFLNNLVLKSLKMVEQSNGKLEILELGAGTGSTTDAVLELIKENNKVTYFYTDISQFFLKEAQRRYADIDNILYSQLNIDDLNFDSKVDIIIANGVLNNAKHIDSTFEKMINLVRPGGKIFIIEQVAESLEILVSQVFMMEDIDNSTESETFRSVEEWKRIFNNDRIEKVEVYPDMHFIEQRLFIISCN